MAIPFDSLATLDFPQKRDLLQLLAELVDVARSEAARKFDNGTKSDKWSVINDSMGLEALYYEIVDRRTALERDHSIPVADLIDPVLQYCNRNAS